MLFDATLDDLAITADWGLSAEENQTGDFGSMCCLAFVNPGYIYTLKPTYREYAGASGSQTS